MLLKQACIFIVLVGAALVSACSESTRPEQPIGDTVQYFGNSYNIENVAVDVGNIVLDPEGYSLIVRLINSDGMPVSFRVQDLGSEPSQLLTVGAHGSSEQSSNSIYSNLTDQQILFYGLNSDQLSIVWESITVGEQTYSGRGYVHIKKRLNYACVDSVHTAEGTFGPGSDIYDRYYDYNCAPGFYFPAQKIRFESEESIIWWNLPN